MAASPCTPCRESWKGRGGRRARRGLLSRPGSGAAVVVQTMDRAQPLWWSGHDISLGSCSLLSLDAFHGSQRYECLDPPGAWETAGPWPRGCTGGMTPSPNSTLPPGPVALASSIAYHGRLRFAGLIKCGSGVARFCVSLTACSGPCDVGADVTLLTSMWTSRPHLRTLIPPFASCTGL